MTDDKKKKNCVVYMRVGTKKQLSSRNITLEEQKDKLMEYAKKYGITTSPK